MRALTVSSQTAIDDTRVWLQRAVIGLNLCPFAKSVHVKGQIHYAVCQTESPEELLQVLALELQSLADSPAHVRDTTLLVALGCLQEFLDFNDFLARADSLLIDLELDGVLQIASFHPEFQFAGTHAADITNYTNRSPYPMLHLLREESIDRAVESFPDAEEIFGNNMKTLERLGLAGWNALGVGPASRGKESL